MGMAAGGGKGAKSDINVTPLVDVCLVLLIIFMVMVPRKIPEISVQIPPTAKAKQRPKDAPQPLVVGLSKDGALSLNKQPIEREALSTKLRELVGSRAKKVVFTDFDDQVPYCVAIRTLELAKKANPDPDTGPIILAVMKEKDRKTPETIPPIKPSAERMQRCNKT